MFTFQKLSCLPSGIDYSGVTTFMVCSREKATVYRYGVSLHLCTRGKATGYIEGAELTKVNTLYSDLLFDLYSRRSNRNKDSKSWMYSMETSVRELKKIIVRFFEDNYE